MKISHGDHADHEIVYHRLLAVAKASGKTLAIMADLQGPKIRLCRFGDDVRCSVTECGPSTGSGCDGRDVGLRLPWRRRPHPPSTPFHRQEP